MSESFKEKTAIIGVGRLGAALARALHTAGCRVLYISSLEKREAEKVAVETGAEYIRPPYKQLSEIDLVFITVPDGKIEPVAEELSNNGVDWRGKTVIHCSGALTSQILKPLKAKGASVMSLHPLQSFPADATGDRFHGVYFALEGDNIELGKLLASYLGGKPVIISPENKSLYHAAATIASNHLFGLLYAAVETTQAAGIPRETANKILLPLISGTLSNICEYGINGRVLTGPLSRGDLEIVTAHLKALKPHPELEEFYRITAKMTLRLVELPHKQKERILVLFKTDAEF